MNDVQAAPSYPDGPIVKFVKKTLVDFPNPTVALYRAMIWEDKIFYVPILIGSVVLVRGLLYIIHTFDMLPLVLLFAGMYLIMSAVVVFVTEKTAGAQSNVDPAKMKDAYDNLTAAAYWAQNVTDGFRQRNTFDSSRLAFELMMIAIVMAIILPMVSIDAVVWLTFVFVMLGPGLLYSWRNRQPPSPPAAVPDDQTDHQSYVPPRRNVPRYEDRSLPADFHHRAH